MYSRGLLCGACEWINLPVLLMLLFGSHVPLLFWWYLWNCKTRQVIFISGNRRVKKNANTKEGEACEQCWVSEDFLKKQLFWILLLDAKKKYDIRCDVSLCTLFNYVKLQMLLLKHLTKQNISHSPLTSVLSSFFFFYLLSQSVTLV